MNNGLTGAGRRRKAMNEALYGKPKESATRISGSVNRSQWLYRGMTLEGRKQGGWASGWRWYVTNWPFGATTRMALMGLIDTALDGAPDKKPSV